MAFSGKVGFLFSSWLDLGSLIKWLVGYKVLKAENIVLVCRCFQTSPPVIQRTFLYSRRIHILVPFYVVGVFFFFFPFLPDSQKNIESCVLVGAIFRSMNWKNSEITQSNERAKENSIHCWHRTLSGPARGASGEEGALWGVEKVLRQASFTAVPTCAFPRNSWHHHLDILSRPWTKAPTPAQGKAN